MAKKNTYGSYLINKYLGRAKKDEKEADSAPYQDHSDAPIHIAFVIDGVVEDIIHCNERLGMLLLSDPVIVEVEDIEVSIEWTYDEDSNTFSKPQEVESIV